MRSADVAAVGDEVLVADSHALTTGKADRVPVAVDVEKAEVFAEGEAVEGSGCVDDDVKRHLVTLGPVLLARGQETIRAHLAGIRLLGSGAGDGPDLGAEGLGEQDAVVAEATDTHDANLLAGAGAAALQRAVDCDAGAEHGGGLGAGEGLGDGVDPAARDM